MSTSQKYLGPGSTQPRAPSGRAASRRTSTATDAEVPGDAERAWLALAALLGTGWFIVGIAVMHVLRPDLDPGTHTISEYALGRYGPVQTVNFLAAAIGSLALALALRRGLRRPGRVGPLLLGLWAVAEVVEAFVHTDGDGPATTAGVVHVVVSLVGFALGIAAMFVLARRFGHDPAWQSFRRPTKLWAAATIATFFLIPVLGPTRAGIGQRITIAILAAWLLETARRLYVMSAVRRPGHPFGSNSANQPD